MNFYLASLLVLGSMSPLTQAFAQAYPAKPVRIIVPFAAGGALDATARIVGTPMAESMGQPVIVENRPGGSSIIGMQACARAPADGYTTCFTVADSLSYNPHLFRDLPYDAEKDFAPVINLVRGYGIILGKGTATFNSFRDMVAQAKAKPGVFNWGTWGPASSPDIFLQWTKLEKDVDIAAVAYKGAGGAAVPALLAGEIDITLMTVGPMLPHIKAGKLKPLAIIGSKRWPGLPDVPSLAEEGADPGLNSYWGVYAPTATPKPLIDRLNAEFAKALKTPKVLEFLRTQTLDPDGGSADEFARFLKEDRANSSRVFKRLGVKPGDAPS
ncbi:MAG: Bug family tripartite tricarboxylate transporter substrate binding protein [Burkholderiales bacterium]